MEVLVAVMFSADGRWARAVFFGLIGVFMMYLLVCIPQLGYRIDALGITSPQGIPLRFTDTMKWDDVAMITWNAAIWRPALRCRSSNTHTSATR